MKRALFSLLAGLVSLSLAGCTFSLSLPTVTPGAPTATSGTPIDTETPPPTLRPTDTLAPTEDTLSQYFEMPKTLQEFKLGTKADIPNILAKLKAGPSHLTEGSPPPEIGQALHNTDTGESYFNIICNKGGGINCAPAAYMQLSEQGIDPHIVIWEIRNRDGSRGYFSRYMYDSFQQPYPKVYEYLLAHPINSNPMQIHIALSAHLQSIDPYDVFLLQQPGYGDVEQWPVTGNVPKSIQNGLILAP
jgi:hypothetical protein